MPATWRSEESSVGDGVMRSHLVLLLLFAFFVSLVFAVIAKDDVRDQVRLGGLMFAGFVVSALVLGWLMYPFPI